VHHHVTIWEFAPKPLGSGYIGPETYAESIQSIATADGRVSLGAWRYNGRLESALTMQNHQIWVITKGSAKVEIDGDKLDLTVGSAVCFEAPYGPKVLNASDGFTAVWISVPRTPAT
jgi:hypothetical protein